MLAGRARVPPNAVDDGTILVECQPSPVDFGNIEM